MNVIKINSENLEKSFNMAKDSYRLTLERFNIIDQKLNMILVLIASLLIAIFTFLFKAGEESVLKMTFSYCLVGMVISNAIIVLIGLFPRGLGAMGEHTFSAEFLLSLSTQEFNKQIIEWMEKINGKTEKARVKKCLILEVSIIVLIFNLVLFFISLFL